MSLKGGMCKSLEFLCSQNRRFSVSSAICKSHYETLGVKSSATLTEIKKAYYNLSMIYHPDKNDGCEEAIKKFREVTEAYEVLSNIKNKKMYDKGMYHGTPTQQSPKANVKKSKYTPQTGRTAYYDFDEWTRAHYGKTFERRSKERFEFEFRERMQKDAYEREKTSVFNAFVLAFLTLSVVLQSFVMTRSYDDVPEKKGK